MVERVSTYAQTTRINSDLMRLQAKYAEGNQQQSSGLVSQNYKGYGSDVQKLLNLESDYARLTSQSEAAQTALNEATLMSSALQSVSDLITNYKSSVSAAISGSSADTATLESETETGWAELVSLLNSQSSGSYLFGGGVTDQMPVDPSLSAYPAAAVPSTADASYYTGDDYLKSVQASDTQKVSYGVTANDPAFEQVMRAFNLVSNNPSDTATLEEAFTLLDSALKDISALQSKVATASSTLDSVIDRNATDLNTLDSVISGIKEVDVTEVLLRLKNLETQIEASYSVSSNLLQLSLIDYL